MAIPRARTVIPASEATSVFAIDRIVLPHDGRYRRRVTMRCEGDLVFLLDLPEATWLRHGDALGLEDGRTVLVVAAEEPIVEITARNAHELARIAWHLGNRHVPAEIGPHRIRIARDPVLEDMIRGLGAVVTAIESRFEPEGGAYQHGSAHGHHHDERTDHRHNEHHPERERGGGRGS